MTQAGTQAQRGERALPSAFLLPAPLWEHSLRDAAPRFLTPALLLGVGGRLWTRVADVTRVVQGTMCGENLPLFATSMGYAALG